MHTKSSWLRVWTGICLLSGIVLIPAHGAQDPFAVRLGLSPTPRVEEQPSLSLGSLDTTQLDTDLERLNRLMDRIMSMVGAGDLAGARQQVDAALLTYGNWPLLLHVGASIALRMNNYSSVIDYYSRLQWDQLNAQQIFEASFYKGASLLSLGRLDEAAAALHRAQSLYPSDHRLQFSLMLLYAAQQNDSALSEIIAQLEFRELAMSAGVLNEEFDDLIGILGADGFVAVASGILSGGLDVERLEPAMDSATIGDDEWLTITPSPSGGMTASERANASHERVQQLRAQSRALHRLYEQFAQTAVDQDPESVLALGKRVRGSRLRLMAPAFWSMIDYTATLAGEDDALERLTARHRQHPHQLAANRYTLLALWDQHQYESALELLSSSMSQPAAHSAERHALLACAQVRAGKIEAALSTLESLLERYPVFARHWFANPNPYQYVFWSDPVFADWLAEAQTRALSH